jgi:hypothetical protein
VLFFLSYTVRQHFKLKVDSELGWMPFHIVVACNMLSNSVRKEVIVLFFLSYTVRQHFKLIQNYAVQQCKKGSNCVVFPFLHCSTAFLRHTICQLMLLSNSVRKNVIFVYFLLPFSLIKL